MESNLLLQGIGRWLTPESLPAWIAALLMAGGWFYTWRRGRMRPSKIVVFEANRTLFTKLSEAERRLSIAFNGQEIESLAMIDLAVRNEGASTIENIDFTIEVNEQARILAIQPQTMPPGVAFGAVGHANKLEVAIDFLNPFSLGKEQVRLAVFCEPEPGAVRVKGGGKGWSLEFIGRADLRARKVKRARLGIVALWMTWFLGPLALLGVATLAEALPGPTFPWWSLILGFGAGSGLMIGVLWRIGPKVSSAVERLITPYPY